MVTVPATAYRWLMAAFEVAIVGAGIHGASAAFHLATRGVRVIVLERGVPAGGPTGRSSAVCRGYYTNPFLARVARESIDMLADFRAVTSGGDAGFVRTGALFLHPPEDGEQLAAAVRRLTAIGTRTEVFGRDDLAGRFPMVHLDGIGWGAWEEDAGYADPARATTGLLARAVQLGAEVRTRTAVHAIAAGARGLRLRAGNTTVAADRLLLAAGPWTRPLARQLGVDLPLHVERHIVASLRWGAAAPLPFVCADIPGSFYLKPEGAGQFLLGPLHEEPRCDPDAFPERLKEAEGIALTARAVARIPHLAAAEPAGGWASLYDVSPDWQPVIGQIAERVVVDAGTSGHGFKLAPALGRHVADLVLGEAADPDLAPFHPRRFAAGAGLSGGYGRARILG